MTLFQLKLKTLSPSYFALVMATGIISIAAYFEELPVVAHVLFYVNIVFLLLLFCLFSYRSIYYKKQILQDFRSYEKGPGFFTIVAAFCIVGNQLVLLFNAVAIAETILMIAVIGWLIIIYGFFFTFTITKDKKSLKEGISGSWLLIVVAIQALSALVSLVSQDFDASSYLLLFLALCLFLIGCIFYLYFMSLIIYRISFFSLNVDELGAPYWINMGATAISVLAGSMLILHSRAFHFIVDILPFLKGFTLFFWAAGTWWIPLLIILGIWRHLIKREPLPTSAEGYAPTYWAMVFPLGMYTVCTFRLSEALEIQFLKGISDVFIYAAFLAWAAVIFGFLSYWLKVSRNGKYVNRL